MLKTVFVLCLAHLCFGVAIQQLWNEPECSSFDVENCGLYYCIVGDSGQCEKDECFEGYFEYNALPKCGTGCRKVTFDYDVPFYIANGIIIGEGMSFCVDQKNHFSDCALTASTMDLVVGNDDIDGQIKEMETYCAKRQCGGVYQANTKEGLLYYYCAEPDDDGSLTPNDFDTANCKYFEFILDPTDKKTCIVDPCSEFSGEEIENCTSSSSSCKIVQVVMSDGETADVCTSKTEDITACSLGFGTVSPQNDDCGVSGCGPMAHVVTVKGNAHYYCEEKPKPKGQGIVLNQHMPVLAVLSFLIFVFFL